MQHRRAGISDPFLGLVGHDLGFLSTRAPSLEMELWQLRFNNALELKRPVILAAQDNRIVLVVTGRFSGSLEKELCAI